MKRLKFSILRYFLSPEGQEYVGGERESYPGALQRQILIVGLYPVTGILDPSFLLLTRAYCPGPYPGLPCPGHLRPFTAVQKTHCAVYLNLTDSI